MYVLSLYNFGNARVDHSVDGWHKAKCNFNQTATQRKYLPFLPRVSNPVETLDVARRKWHRWDVLERLKIGVNL